MEEFEELRNWLQAAILARWPEAKPVETFGLRGWRIKRLREVPWTQGTVDPNEVTILLADRKQGPVVHLWNPIDWKLLERRKAALTKAGLNVMVGCLAYRRKQPYPKAALEDLLDEVLKSYLAEAGRAGPQGAAGAKGGARRPSKAKSAGPKRPRP